jgi:hypothetical protein
MPTRRRIDKNVADPYPTDYVLLPKVLNVNPNCKSLLLTCNDGRGIIEEGSCLGVTILYFDNDMKKNVYPAERGRNDLPRLHFFTFV